MRQRRKLERKSPELSSRERITEEGRRQENLPSQVTGKLSERGDLRPTRWRNLLSLLVLFGVLFPLAGQPPCDTPAIARDDVAALPAGGSALIDIFANDSDADGEPLDLSGSLGTGDCSSLGTATYNGDGTVTFVAFSGEGGTCSLSYALADGGSASVAVNVAGEVVQTDGCQGTGDQSQDPFGYSSTPATDNCLMGSQAIEKCCWKELIRGLRGEKVCLPVTSRRAASPETELFSGGSENHSVLCQAAEYLDTGNDGWYERYMDAQQGFDLSQNLHGWMGTEVLSPLYGAWIAASNIAALDKARSGPNTELVEKLEDWLLTYWVMQALLANDFPVTESVAELSTATSSVVPEAGYWDGLSIASTGSRRLSDNLAAGLGYSQPPHFMMALALDSHPRNFGEDHLGLTDMGQPEYYYAPLRELLLLEGTDLSTAQNGTVDFQSFHPPAELFGLTDSERETLRLFVESGGNQDPAVVLSLLPANPIPHCVAGTGNRCCEMTFLRTTEGTMGHFGAGQWGRQSGPLGVNYICNRNKPPNHAVRMDLDGTLTLLGPGQVGDFNTPRHDNTYESGNQICAEYALSPQQGGGIANKCIDKPGGEVIYEITWTTDHGLVVRDYNPQGGTPEEPVIQSQPTNVGVAEGVSAGFQILAQSVPPGRALDYHWYRDNSPLPLNDPRLVGVDSAALDISSTVPGDSGSYHCRVTDRLAPSLFTESSAATLTVTPDGPPLSILMDPEDRLGLGEGQTTTFSVTAQGPNGDDSLRYQWQRNGIDLVGSNTTDDFQGVNHSTLSIHNVHNSYEGAFRCRVWDEGDPSVWEPSQTADLTITELRAPYGGSPQTLPGLFQPEYYDEGEPEVVYSDTTPESLGTNEGNWHVRRDAVDFLTGAAQAHIRWAYIAPGEFLKYTVELTQSGTFDLAINYKMVTGPGEIDLDLAWGGPSPGSQMKTLVLPTQNDFEQQVFSAVFDEVPSGSAELTLTSRDTLATTEGLQILEMRFMAEPPTLPELPVAHDDPSAQGAHLPALRDQDLSIDVCLDLLDNDEGDGDLMDCTTKAQKVALEEVFQPQQEGAQVIIGVDQLTYRPAPGHTGADSFQYTVRDSEGQVSAQPATVRVFVNGDLPMAVDDTFTSQPQDPSGSGVTLQILKGTLTGNDQASSGFPIFKRLFNPPSNIVDPGPNSQHLLYTPPLGLSSDSFQYTIENSAFGDGPESLPATVTINITTDIEAPVANPDIYFMSQSRATPQTGIAVSQQELVANDQGSGNFQIYFPDPPAQSLGDFSGHVFGFNFSPLSSTTGEILFPYDLVDIGVPGLPTDRADIRLRVVPFPVPQPDPGFVTPHNTAIEIAQDALFLNDAHHGRQLEAVLEVGSAISGTAVMLASGNILFTPNPGVQGAGGFSYRVVDDLHSEDTLEIGTEGKANRLSDPVAVTIQILPPGPAAADDYYLMPFHLPELLIRWDELLLNDTPSGDVRLKEFYSPQYGTTSQESAIGMDLPITRYVPGLGLWQTGMDSFQYRIERSDQTPPDTALGTVHLTPLTVTNPWVVDSFEGGDLGAWSSTSTVGGSLDVVSKAALTGGLGLQVKIDPAATGTPPGSVLVAVHEDLGEPQSHLWLDFQVDLQADQLDVDPGDSFQLVNSLLSGEGHIEIKARAKTPPEFGFELQALTYQDSDAAATTIRTGWVDVGSGRRWVTLEWKASEAPGANNGALRFWLDHRLVDEKTGLDNDRKTISKVRIGAVKGIDEGTSGSIFYDQISIWPGEDNREILLVDKFEDSLPGSWDRIVAYGGTLQVTSSAALSGVSGLALDIDPQGTGIPASSAAILLEETFDEPQNHLFMEFQFQVDPATFDMPEGEDFVLLPSYYATEGHLEVRLRKSGGKYQLQFTTYQDPGVPPAARRTPWLTIGTVARWISIEWLAATEPGSVDGALRVWIDHQLAASVLDVDNDQKTIQRLRLGAVSRVDEGTSGRLFFDHLTFWRGSGSRRNLHADNFESGDLTAWDLTTGNASATSGASLLGAYGLQVDVAGADDVGTVTDESPAAANTYEVRLLLDTSNLNIGPSDRFILLQGTSSSGLTVFEIKVDGGGGSPRIRPVMSGPTTASTAWVPLTSGSQELRFLWQSTSAGGTVEFWIDDTLATTSAYNSGDLTLDAIEVGAVRGIDAGTTGTLAIDEFRSWE
ncbi:MAG: hypothetical protein K0U98_07095 [Deltaproteobacteria bacterium]|nr:hypothetical protein [Deltaproteobacteria bacterium]